MINDNTIDTTTAEYWCIFADKSFQSKFQEFLKKAEITDNKDNKQSKLNEDILSSLGTGFSSFLSLAGIVFTISGFYHLLEPYIMNIIKNISNNTDNSIAFVKFNADDKDYIAEFNIKKMKWILKSSINVSEYETSAFFSTQFFKSFLTQCAKYILPIIKSKDQILKHLDIFNDIKAKTFIEELCKNDKRLIDNMFNARYLT